MKRFQYLKPVKTKDLFYNSKNTGSMRTKERIKKMNKESNKKC